MSDALTGDANVPAIDAAVEASGPAKYADTETALRQAGRFEEAEAVLREAVARFPDDVRLTSDFAVLAVQRRDWPAALERWQTVKGRFPDRASGFSGEALALREMRRFDEADALLRGAMDRFPDDPAF